MGVNMGWIQIKMGHPLAQNGAALAPFRANGAHPIATYSYLYLNLLSSIMRLLSKYVRTVVYCACALSRRQGLALRSQGLHPALFSHA